MISRFSVSKDLNPHRILEAEDASSKLKPSNVSFIGPCNERASWVNGTAWRHDVHIPYTPNKPINHGERLTLKPRHLVYPDWLGATGFYNAWSSARHETRRMLEAGCDGINGIGSSRYQVTTVTAITNAAIAH